MGPGPMGRAHGPLGPSLGPGPRGGEAQAGGCCRGVEYRVPGLGSPPLAPRRLWGPAQGLGPRAHELEAYGVSSIRGFEATSSRQRPRGNTLAATPSRQRPRGNALRQHPRGNALKASPSRHRPRGNARQIRPDCIAPGRKTLLLGYRHRCRSLSTEERRV